MEGEQYRQPDSGHGSTVDITLDITHDLELNFAEGEQGEENTSEEEEGDGGGGGGGRVGSNGGTVSGGKTSSKASTPGKDGSSSSQSSEHESGGGKAHLTPSRGSGREQENTPGELMSRGRGTIGRAGSNATPRLEQAASPAVVDARGAGDGRRRQQRAVVGGGVEAEGVQGWQGEREVGGEGLHARVEVEGVEESVSSRVSRTMWHQQSDLVVKPIMLNRRIEKIPDPVYEARHLSFIPKSADALEKASSSQAEAFISTVVASLANSPTQTEKMNTLGYLESLSGSTGASNVLINSALMTFLVKQLRTARQPNVNVRVQLISLMGLLIRHATLIREGLAASGIVSVLADCLRDEHERVRRRAMASLGELLFYVATQSKLAGANHAAWQVPATTISLVNALLRKGEDEMTQHYAVKTIENVASEEGGEWGARFATAENLSNLCHIYKHANSKQEHLKLTAGMCLVRLARFGQSWVQVLVDKFGVRELVVGLGRGTSKEQQIHINLLTMALLGGLGGQGGPLGKQLAEDKTLVPAVSALLDNSSEVLRGKALLCSALLCNANRQLLVLLCTSKLVPAVERLRRDRDEYVRGCLETLVSTIVALVPPIMAQIAADARGVKVQAPHAGSRAQQQLRKSLDLFQMLLHLITSGPFRGRIVDATLLRQLAGFLVHLEGPGFEGQEEFQSTLMSALEALSQHTDLLLRYRCAVQDHLLPALLSLQMRAASGDMQAMCLKILTDILGAVAAEEAGEGEEQLREFVRNDLLPLFPSFLKKEDPMPMYAQKLLLALMDHRVIQVADIHRLQLTPKFFELLCGDFEALNTPTVLLCLALTGSPQVDTRMLSSLQVVAKLGALLENIYDKQMETFLEHVLALCHLFLRRDADESGAGGGAGGGGGGGKGHRGIRDIVDFGQYSDMFLEISGSFVITIAEVAGECLQYCMDVAPVESAEGLLRNAFLFQNLLESPATEHPHVLVHKLQQQHMSALVVALREQQQEPLVDLEVLQQHSALIHVVSGLRESPNSEVASIAYELLSELEQI